MPSQRVEVLATSEASLTWRKGWPKALEFLNVSARVACSAVKANACPVGVTVEYRSWERRIALNLNVGFGLETSPAARLCEEVTLEGDVGGEIWSLPLGSCGCAG